MKKPARQPKAEGVNAYRADDSEKQIQQVILPAQEITLPEMLKHIEAGRIVILILNTGTKAKPR